MQKKLKRLLTCLTGLLALSACASCANMGLKPFPTDRILEVNKNGTVCGEYRVTDPERLLFAHVADHPLSYCYGMFGFKANKVSPVINWSRDAITKAKQRCQ